MGPSLSLNDIANLRSDGRATAYYVDRLGCQEVPGVKPLDLEEGAARK